MKPLRLALYSLVPLVLVVVATELALGALGLGETERDVSRGFDPSAAYLVPDPEVDGGWVTQMFDRPGDEVRVPPKGEAVRVLLFGGSNTQGFPAFVLQQELHRRLRVPRGNVEVFNLGRKGYGSERVGYLVGQAVERLEPDIVVVYCGHNEFIEWGFRAELAEERGETAGLVALASELRAFRLMVSAFSPDQEETDEGGVTGAPTESGTPEAWSYEFERFKHLDLAASRAHLENYRANLRAMCEAAQAAGAEVVLCTLVTNHFSSPTTVNPPAGMDAEDVREFTRLWLQLKQALPEGLAALSPTSESQRPLEQNWRASGEGGRTAPPAFRALGPPFDDGAWYGYPPERWDAVATRLARAMEALHARELDDEDAARIEEALLLADQAEAVWPEHAGVLFVRGTCLWMLGRDDAEAARLIRRAALLECAPRKVNDHHHEIVRTLARDEGTQLFDAAAIAEGASPDGLVGWELMLDYCHLHQGARTILMGELATFLAPLVEPRLSESRE